MKLSHENQTENEEFIKLMRLNVPIGMKYFIEMIMMTNLAIRTIVVPFKTAVPHRTKSQTKSHWVTYKRKKIQREGRKQKERTKIESLRKKKKIENKNRYYHQSNAPVEIIQSIVPLRENTRK